ncbi:MAG TPA: hypothetical protein VF469_12490 [Kofleriaceae bacterium]
MRGKHVVSGELARRSRRSPAPAGPLFIIEGEPPWFGQAGPQPHVPGDPPGSVRAR